MAFGDGQGGLGFAGFVAPDLPFVEADGGRQVRLRQGKRGSSFSDQFGHVHTPHSRGQIRPCQFKKSPL